MALERLEITRAKELRNDIIIRLYGVYPAETALSTIRNLLRYKSYTTEQDIKKAMYYLEGKGYIRLPAQETGMDLETTVSLTPRGINLAEGDIADVGVLQNE